MTSPKSLDLCTSFTGPDTYMPTLCTSFENPYHLRRNVAPRGPQSPHRMLSASFRRDHDVGADDENWLDNPVTVEMPLADLSMDGMYVDSREPTPSIIRDPSFRASKFWTLKETERDKVMEFVLDVCFHLPHSPYLEKITIHHTHVDQNAMYTFLVRGLNCAAAPIKRLILQWCNINYETILPLSQWLTTDQSKPLEELDLAHNSIDPHCVIILTEILPRSNVTKLSLRANPLYDENSTTVMKMLADANGLRSVDLGMCPMADTCCIKLCTVLALPSCRLRHLCIDGWTVTQALGVMLLDTICGTMHGTLTSFQARHVVACSSSQFQLRLNGALASNLAASRKRAEDAKLGGASLVKESMRSSSPKNSTDGSSRIV